MEANSESTLRDINEVLQIAELADEVTSSSSDEDSDSEDDAHPRCTNFVGTIDAMSDKDFKSHMRIMRGTADFLIERYSQSPSGLSCTYLGRSKISPKCCVYIYVWYISNTVTFRQLGNLFGVTKSTAWQVVRRITSWLITISHEYIKWPQEQEISRNCHKFYEKRQIPNVIGAIDCTHISIKAPKIGKENYFDRKQNYSLVLQAVVDADKKFIDVYCGEPGSLHDSRVLRLFAHAEQSYEEMFPNSTFILGDSAYFSTKWLVPPYKDNGHLTELQRRFNQRHSQTRVAVEHTFGLFKTRFRRLLKFTEHTDLNAVTNLICSICVMHNICIIKDDIGEEENVEQVDLNFGFEMEKRLAYDQSLAEALHAEKAWTELHDLISQLQTKITEAANTIRCSTCGLRHPRRLTDRPHYAARECASCKIRHSAREGDIWAETSMLGLRWRYLALMEGKVYDITEWANCQKGALAHLEPNSHMVQYRIVRGAQQQQQQHQQQQPSAYPHHSPHHQNPQQPYTQQPGSHHERNGSGKFKRNIPPSEASLHEFLDNLYGGQHQNPANSSTAYSNPSRRRTRRN